MDKAELLDRIAGLDEAKRQAMPKWMNIYGTDGSVATVQTACTDAMKSHAWDIMRTERGYSYIETDRKGIIRLAKPFGSIEEAAGFAWDRLSADSAEDPE